MANRRPIRADIARAGFNESHVGILSVQVLILSIGLGLWASSWLAFGAAFAGLAWLVNSRFVMFLVTAMSVGWGLVGGVVGSFLGGLPAAVVFSVMGFAVGFVVNQSGAQYVQDVADPNQLEM